MVEFYLEMLKAGFESQLNAIPEKPGVYLLKDRTGKIIYVGKATSLYHRVSSYFNSSQLKPKIIKMIAHVDDLEYIITGSEQEAFLLECNMIKTYRPQYNIRLKDDKTYPYLKISVNEVWPRVYMTRRVEDDGARYFGPFADAGSLRRTLGLLKKLFHFRSCRKSISGSENRPCLEYHINRCLGPCISAISMEDYRHIISQVILFLEGRDDMVIRDLQQRMTAAADNLEFEKAAMVRDQISSVQSIVEGQKIASAAGEMDMVAIAGNGDQAYALVFMVRNGKLVAREHFMLTGVKEENLSHVITSFLQQYYSSAPGIPARILIQDLPEDVHLLKEWLQDRRGSRVHIEVPRRGRKRDLVKMVEENAEEGLRQYRIKVLAEQALLVEALSDLRDKMVLPGLPIRIECYDISNIQGRSAAGSMVVFMDGQARKTEYRRFKITDVPGADDYAMLRQVLRRRFKRTSESEDDVWANMPDLVLIDGGKGHLGAALQALGEIGLSTIPCASIAKENEEIFLVGAQGPLILPHDSSALYLLQRIRDEAHRFAIGYHRKLHKRTAHAPLLDNVPGVGPKRNRALLRHFGSVKRVREASLEELASVKGMTRTAARKVKEYL